MKRSVRLPILILLAAFALGTVVHAASTTSMSIDMTLAGAGGTNMADCEGCSDDCGNLPSCDGGCATPLFATMMADASTGPEGAGGIGAMTRSFLGAAAPPDPYPPRSIIIT